MVAHFLFSIGALHDQRGSRAAISFDSTNYCDGPWNRGPLTSAAFVSSSDSIFQRPRPLRQVTRFFDGHDPSGHGNQEVGTGGVVGEALTWWRIALRDCDSWRWWRQRCRPGRPRRWWRARRQWARSMDCSSTARASLRGYPLGCTPRTPLFGHTSGDNTFNSIRSRSIELSAFAPIRRGSKILL